MKTVYNLKLDFEKSHGSYFFDKVSKTEYLDFFGMFSSLPLGYNHPVFDESFHSKIRSVSKIRMPNNLFNTDELEEFVEKYQKYVFSKYIHFTCTGALAVEAGIKCALEYKKLKDNSMVLGLKKSFHGINSWGFITDRYLGTADRMKNFPENNWQNFSVKELIEFISNNDQKNISAVIVEPIQCTAGDIYIDSGELVKLRQICSDHDICFIVDEIQTGFGVTGKMWYSEQINLDPDVLIFGKKSQICGIVVKEKYNECMVTPLRKLDVTFDGELIDAIRATYILKVFEQDNLLEKVKENAKRFATILSKKVLNYRGIGHLIAFDFICTEDRNKFVEDCFKRNLLINSGGSKSVRLRPHLAITSKEIDHFESIINEVLLGIS